MRTAAADLHPSSEDLRAFVLGTLAADSGNAVEEHLAACPDCQEAASAIPADTLVTLLRTVHTRLDSLAPTPLDAGNTLAWEPLPADPSVPPPALAGHPRYRLIRLLGSGGMGAVWLAEHTVMGRQVALKVIRPEHLARPGAVERFRREVRAASRLHHPNIVAAHDAEQAGDCHFLVTEFVEGQSLAERVALGGPLPVAEACRAARDAALGLQHAHEHGLVHRDVKPQNLMLTPDGQVKVLDFGLASITGPGAGELTGTNVVMGTPDYIAPEQAEDPRAADARSDVYALGCTLYCLLAGRVPFPGDSTLKKLDAHRTRSAEPIRKLRPEVPVRLAAVLAKMMAKDPVHRYQTAATVAAALETAATPDAPRRPRWPFVAVAAALLGVALLAGIAVYRIQTDTGELVISTESPEVEVVIKQGGKEVAIIDAKTNHRITLRSGDYELGLKDAPEGMKLSIDKATLSRGGEVIARIERVVTTPPQRQAAKEQIAILHRVAIPEGNSVRQTAASPDGKLFAAAVEGHGVIVWNAETGKEEYRLNGSLVQFAHAGNRVVTADGAWLLIYDTVTGKKVSDYDLPRRVEAFYLLPGDRHFVASIGEKEFVFGDLEVKPAVLAWSYRTEPHWAVSEDGKTLFVKFDNERGYRVIDVPSGQPSEFFKRLASYDRIWTLHAGPKQALVTVGETSYLIKAEDGEKIQPLPARPEQAVAVGRGAANLRTAFNAYADGTLRLYDPLTGAEKATFRPSDGEKVPHDNTIWLTRDGRSACVATDRSVYWLRLP